MPSDRVDRENKIIRGYSVMSLGEAKGHGFEVDETTLEQLVSLGNASQAGMKTRVRHPSNQDDGFGRYLGQSVTFRRDGNRVVADLLLSKAAFVAPGGDIGTYLMERADEGGAGFGASPEIEYYLEKRGAGKLPVARLKSAKAIAIVDDPATNTAFFSCLSTKDDDMADVATLETKTAELTAERDLLNEEVTRLKTRVTALESESATKSAELSAAKSDSAAAAITAERARAGDILALCQKAGKADLSAKYITDGTPTADVQRTLFDVLCTGNKPVGEGDSDLNAKKDEDSAYKTEYAALSAEYAKRGVSESDYVAMRRIDDGKDQLTKQAA